MHAWRSDAALPTQERASKRWEAEHGCEERRGAVTQTEACKISAPPPPKKSSPPPSPRAAFLLPTSLLGLMSPQGGQLSILPGSKPVFWARGGQHPVSVRCSAVRQCRELVGDCPGAGQRGTAPQTSGNLSCFVGGRCY